MPITSRAVALSRANVLGCIRARKSVAARPLLGMNVPCIDRRPADEMFAVYPCQVDASNRINEPAGPHVITSSGCGAAQSASTCAGVSVQRCEPGTKRVAPLSGRKSSTIRITPSMGHASDVHVQLLRGATRVERARMQNAQPERPANDASRRVEHRRPRVEQVELRP